MYWIEVASRRYHCDAAPVSTSSVLNVNIVCLKLFASVVNRFFVIIGTLLFFVNFGVVFFVT